MFTIQHSNFLQALGYAIGHSIWQLGIIWLIYYACSHINSLPSKTKYAFAASAALAGTICFIITFSYYFNGNIVPSVYEQATIQPKFITTLGSEKISSLLFYYHSFVATLSSMAPFFSCAYLVVIMVLVARLANGLWQVKQLRAVGIEKSPYDLKLFVAHNANLLGIKKEVKVFVSTIAQAPLTIGFWKPIILIPLASLNHLSCKQMEAVLLHELAHIRRHDYLINLMLQSAEILLFFNPFMRLLLKQARLERENSCDDFVLQFNYDAADYARALLALETYSCASLLALGTNNKNKFQLLHRVKRMVAPEKHVFNYRQQLGLLFFITILCLGFTVIVPKTSPAKQNVIVQHTTTLQEKELTLPQITHSGIDLVKTLENIGTSSEKQIKKDLEFAVKKDLNNNRKNTVHFDEIINPAMEQASAVFESADFKKAMDELEFISEINKNNYPVFEEIINETSNKNKENILQFQIEKGLAAAKKAIDQLPEQLKQAKFKSEQFSTLKNSLFDVTRQLSFERDKSAVEKAKADNEQQQLDRFEEMKQTLVESRINMTQKNASFKQKKEAEAEAAAQIQRQQLEARKLIEAQGFSFKTYDGNNGYTIRKPKQETTREAPIPSGITIAKGRLANQNQVKALSPKENPANENNSYVVNENEVKRVGNRKVSINNKTIFSWDNNLDLNAIAQDLNPKREEFRFEIPVDEQGENKVEGRNCKCPKTGSKKVIIITIDRGDTNISIQSSRKP